MAETFPSSPSRAVHRFHFVAGRPTDRLAVIGCVQCFIGLSKAAGEMDGVGEGERRSTRLV